MNVFRFISSRLRILGESFALELKHIYHDQGVVLFFLFVPVVYPVIYSLIYNPELVRDVEVVVVDHDRTPLSRELVRDFNATQGADVIGYAADLSEAKQALHGHDCYAILEIPEGFQRHTGRGEQGLTMLYCEMSLMLRYRSLLFAATDLSLDMGAKIMAADISSIGASSMSGSLDPMPIEAVAEGNLQSGFDSFVMPGVLMLILQQCVVLAVGMMGGSCFETARRGINPVNSAGESTFVTMIGRTLCYLVILILPLLWLDHFVPMLFKFPMAGNMWQIFAFLLPLVLSSIFLGFIVQCIVHEREAVFIIWVATSILFVFLSGLTWPRYAMSPLWQFIGGLVPATWGLNGFILMNTNGASLSDVSYFYDNLWCLTALYFVIAWVLHRFWLRPRLRLIADRAAAIPSGMLTR